jgi:hypothetical protein
VFLRGAELWLAWPTSEAPLWPLDEGEYRVGDRWSPDRVRFDTIVDDRAQHAVYNAVTYARSFLE